MSRNRKFKKKMKNMLATVATLLLIIGVSVGVTLALLWGKSNTKDNVFTGSEGVKAVLSEDKWDGSDADHPSPNPVDSNPNLGYNKAKTYTPGLDIPKNPIITNQSKDEDVWVMMRVQYAIQADPTAVSDLTDYIPVTKEEFNKMAKVQHGAASPDINTDDWLEAAANVSVPGISIKKNPVIDNTSTSATYGTCYYYYYYKSKLDKTSNGSGTKVTKSLFDNIKILDSFTLTDTGSEITRFEITPASTTKYNAAHYYTYKLLPAFKISVEGAVISVETGDPVDLQNATNDDSATRKKNKIISELQDVFISKTGTSGN